jgi:hypothetical protein
MPQRRHEIAVIGVCSLVACLAYRELPAAAQPRTFIAWEAPAECPGRLEFAAMVQKHLGETAPADQIHVEVTIQRRGRRLELTLHTTRGADTGERTLTGTDCAVLAETAALALALAIAPDAVATRPVRPETNAGRDDEPLPATTAVVIAPGGERGLDVGVRVAALGDVGSFPDAAPGLGAAVSAQLGRWRAEAYVGYWFEQRATNASNMDEAVDLTTAVGGVRGCFQVHRGALDLELCGAGELSRTRGRGADTIDGFAATWLWASLGGGVSAARRISRHLRFRLDIGIMGRPRTRPRFTFTNSDDVLFRPAWVSGQASAGLEVRFQ